MTRRRVWIAATVLPGCFLVIVAAGLAGDEPPNLGGVWQLNEELSDDPAEKMREAARSRGVGGRGGGMRGGRGGMGGPPGGGMRGGRGDMGGPEDGGRNREAMRERLAELQRSLRSMSITHEEQRITIRYADGRERLIHTDGRKQHEDDGLGNTDTRAKWKKGGLVVKGSNERGQRITETFAYVGEEGRLHVTTRIEGEGGMPTLAFLRVYDGQTGEGAEN